MPALTDEMRITAKPAIDRMSAVILLQDYLDSRGMGGQ